MYKNETIPSASVEDELAFARLEPDVQRLAQRVLLPGKTSGMHGHYVLHDVVEQAVHTMREAADRLVPFAGDLTIHNIRKVLCQRASECAHRALR